MPDVPPLQGLVGRRVALPGHFVDAVTVVGARPLGAGAEPRVRQADGEFDEAMLSREDLAPLLAADPDEGGAPAPADPEAVRLLVESTRIRLAYVYDRQFAVSLSGIRTLPHQIEAVYLKMLPQPRLRSSSRTTPARARRVDEGGRRCVRVRVAEEWRRRRARD